MVANVEFLKVFGDLGGLVPALLHFVHDALVLKLAGLQTIEINVPKSQKL